MKSPFIILLIALSIMRVNASCSGNGLDVFPSGKYIKQNSIFIIDGYAASQKIVRELNKNYPIYLKGKNHKIRLIVREIIVGEYKLTQALLIPESPLKADIEYTLIIDNLPPFESFGTWNNLTKKMEPFIYSVEKGTDNIRPEFTLPPKEIEKSYIRMGCGPSMHVKFSCKITDSSEYLVKATVKSIKSNKETTYYVKPDKESIRIGRGMCSGPFGFGDGDEYEIEFELIDACGNLTAWTGDRIKFSRPEMKIPTFEK